MKTQKVIVRRNLCIRDSLVASIPSIVSMFLWGGTLIIGVKQIKLEFGNTEWYGIVCIIWMLVMMQFTKMVTIPVTTWNIEEHEIGS